MGEKEILAYVRERFRSADPTVTVGTGPDDCAFVSVEAGQLAITTDALVEGTHFSAGDAPESVGWKAMAVNLSDLAASGSRPRWAVVAASIRKSAGEAWARAVVRGLAECAAAFGIQIVGGDTTTAEAATCLSVTALGTPYPGGPVLRSGARPGDTLLVTGALGGSLLGRHLRPVPRLAEIETLLRLGTVHACMDLSDGLALDLSRLLAESGCGATLVADAIPLSPDALTRSRESGETPLAHALHDGEDFELLCAVPPETLERIAGRWSALGSETPITGIGRIDERPGMRIRRPDGTEEPLEPGGFTHEFA
jgi:thiamine-monophosphate kinase